MEAVMPEGYARQLEKATGHRFKDRIRLERALTHASVQDAGKGNYERLEFLGDRVLGLVVAEMICCIFPDATEGELSVRLNALVNAEVCTQIAEEIGLPGMIHMGPEMKSLEGRRLGNMYADVVEALIAVIYLDGGLEAARLFVFRYWDERIRRSENQRRDAKTELQEWAHRQGGVQPIYRILRRKGPDHEPVFEVELRVSGFASTRGKGQSKRQAERAAAEEMLYREGVWVQGKGNGG